MLVFHPGTVLLRHQEVRGRGCHGGASTDLGRTSIAYDSRNQRATGRPLVWNRDRSGDDSIGNGLPEQTSID